MFSFKLSAALIGKVPVLSPLKIFKKRAGNTCCTSSLVNGFQSTPLPIMESGVGRKPRPWLAKTMWSQIEKL